MYNKLSKSIVKQKYKKTKKYRKSKANKRHILNGGSMEVALAHMQLPVPDILTKEYLKKNSDYCYKLYELSIDLVIKNNYTFVLELLQKWFKKNASDDTTKKLFNPYLTLPIPFITEVQDSIGFTTDFYYKWYMSKNPDLKVLITETEVITPIDTTCTITTSVGKKTFPIYETLLAQICRDICILLVKKHFFEDDILQSRIGRIANKRNTRELAHTNMELFINLLKKCNDCIQNDYNYLLVCQICDEFMVSMSTSAEYKRHYLYNNEFIFFPTTSQVSYQSMVLLITAPIINFRLNNRMRETHTVLEYPTYDFNHNVADHAKTSHKLDAFMFNENMKPNFQPWFTNISNFIKILSKYFFVPPKDKLFDIKYTSENIVKDKTMYSFVLFALLHEYIDFCFLVLMPIIINKKLALSESILDKLTTHLNVVASADRLTSVIKTFNSKPSNLHIIIKNFKSVINYFVETIITEANNLETGTLFKENIRFLYNTLLSYFKESKNPKLQFYATLNTDLLIHIQTEDN